MSVLGTDDFNRANSGTLGANWTEVTGENNFQIVSNHVEADSPTADDAAYWNAASFPADHYSQATAPTMTTASLGQGMGVLVRAAAASRDYYRTVVCTTGSEIAKFVGGSYTQLATNGTAWANGDTVYLSAVGTTIQVKRNGSNLYSTTDGAHSSGSAGVNHSGVTNAGDSLDDWEGGDFVSTTRRFLLVR